MQLGWLYKGRRSLQGGDHEGLKRREVKKSEWEYDNARTSVNLHIGLKPRCLVVLIPDVCCSAFPDLHICQAHIQLSLYWFVKNKSKPGWLVSHLYKLFERGWNLT